MTSQALSTVERKGRTGSPVPGQLVRTEPSYASYQLNQKPCARSSFSTAASVRDRRWCMTDPEITPRPAAATVDHRPQPMLVDEVWVEGTGAPVPETSIVSAVRPSSVVMAVIER